ncbi:cytoplasmic polyadenylation element-binding protein 3-like isoform X2 [Rhincodon typus]|uniref:cytoplasmic polyadenylation element-binding protein 3-like isoform X2 n=1 Tax=Rhincodon typus TaxID=259920 RepID=UPI002030992E|nr:cytoplasmic polyadenylation element-binding protein 3-like isoform X2 [Rhincodon typus]
MQDDDFLMPDRTTDISLGTTCSAATSASRSVSAPSARGFSSREDRQEEEKEEAGDITITQCPYILTKPSHHHHHHPPPLSQLRGRPQSTSPGEGEEEEGGGDRDRLSSTDAALKFAESSQQHRGGHRLMESPGNMTAANGGGGGIGMLPGLSTGFQQQQQQQQQLHHHQDGGSGGGSAGGGSSNSSGGSSSSNGSSPSPVAALTGFGTAWSPAPAAQVSTPSASGVVASAAAAANTPGLSAAGPGTCPVPSPAEDSFFHGIPSINGTVLFQSFAGMSQGYGGGGGGTNFSPLPQQQQQQSRRSPVGLHHHHHPQHQAAFPHQRSTYNHHQPIMKQSPWNSHQSSGWSAGVSWGGMQTRDHRRSGGVGMPTTMNQISPLKKPFSSNIIAPPKFPRSAPTLPPKSWIEDNVFRTDNNSNTLLPLQSKRTM